MVTSLLAIFLMLLLQQAHSQSGDEYLIPVKGPLYEVEEGEGDLSGHEEAIKLVADQPLTSPPCLLPHTRLTSSNKASSKQRHSWLNEREVLNSTDLHSEKILLACLLAVDHFIQENENSTLKLLQLLGGCKQHIAGELLYLMFSAEETMYCQNCTGPVVLDRECRARIHVTHFRPWDPFYVMCKDPEYFALPWKKLTS